MEEGTQRIGDESSITQKMPLKAMSKDCIFRTYTHHASTIVFPYVETLRMLVAYFCNIPEKNLWICQSSLWEQFHAFPFCAGKGRVHSLASNILRQFPKCAVSAFKAFSHRLQYVGHMLVSIRRLFIRVNWTKIN